LHNSEVPAILGFMKLFSLRKNRRICQRHRGPGQPAPAHGSTNIIKCWSLATGSMARIKPIESVSLLGCLDPIRHWVAISSSQPMQESPGADLTTEAASTPARGGASRPSTAAHQSSSFLELWWSVFNKVCFYGITVMRGMCLC
jgi:hypothetical protein